MPVESPGRCASDAQAQFRHLIVPSIEEYREPVSDEPTQRTGKGYEIPIPKRDDIMRIFDKAAQPVDEKPKRKRRAKKK